MTDLLALADRVEKAEAGSRELDAEIAAAIRYHPFGSSHWIGGADIEIRATGHCVQAFRATGESCGNWQPPEYSASLDAAMSLVPESVNWLFGKGKTRPDEPLFAFQILDHGGTSLAESESDIRECCVVAAALRARANGSAG